MKKKIIITAIIIILMVSTIGVTCFIKSKKVSVDIKEDIKIALNEEAYNLDYISVSKNGKIISPKERIDTSKIGQSEIEVTIEDYFHHQYIYIYIITIIDEEPPQIEYKEKITINEGDNIDLLKDVKVIDNSNEEIIPTIEGDYNPKKAGTYSLKYIAKDSSGNTTTKDFTLEVKAKKVVVQTPKPAPSQNSQTPTQPTPVQDTTFTTSKGFNGYTKNGITYIDGIIIANKSYSLPSTYSPNGLTSETKNAFDQMIAAASLDGITIRCQSGFRSYSTQQKLYNNYVNRDGKQAADTYSARPGYSEHQSGLACDICSNDSNSCINSNFHNTNAAKWASNNAYKYGLILRYPKDKTAQTGYLYESWHFRYVGVDLATKLYNNGNWITLEEYFGIDSVYK